MNGEPLAPTPIGEQKPAGNTWKSVVKEILIFAAMVGIIFFVIRPYVAEPYIVDGASMSPTFETGDYLIVDKFSYQFNTPERNSVVVFKFPKDTTRNFIKRIIGLPGEKVIVKGGKVTIINPENPDGFELDQPYITKNDFREFQISLNADQYFVMGDNRADSYDSRSWGPVDKKYILGKPVLRLFPLSKLGLLPGDDTKNATPQSLTNL